MVAINTEGIRDDFRFGKSEANEGVFHQTHEELPQDTKERLLGHFVIEANSVTMINPNQPEAVQEVMRSLEELQADLLASKSRIRQVTESALNVVAGSSIARIMSLGLVRPVGTFNGFHTSHTANTESLLFNDTETLNLVCKLARLPDSDSTVTPGIRDKARSVLKAWTKTSLRLNPKIGKDDTTVKSNENRTDSGIDAIEQILTGDTKAIRLRGVSTIVELASRQGEGHKSLEKYLDRIESSFNLVGSGLAEIVRREVRDSIKDLHQIKKEPAIYMDEDATVVRDFSKAVSKLALEHIRKNPLAANLQELINADPETKAYTTAREKVFNTIESYRDKHIRYSNLEEKYTNVETRLNQDINDYSVIEFQFMTQAQLAEVYSRNGSSYNAAITREDNVRALETLTGANSAHVIVTVENIEIAAAAKTDAQSKVSQLEKEINKLTEPISESLRNIPELADSIFDMIGYRYGYNTGANQEDIFEGVLTQKEEATMRSKFETQIQRQISTKEAQIQSYEKQKTNIEAMHLGSRQKVLDFANSIGLNDNSQRATIIKELAANISERHNSKVQIALESLHSLSNNSTDDDLIRVASKVIDFAEQEIILDKADGKTPLNSTPSIRNGFNGAPNPNYSTIVIEAKVLENKDRLLGEFESHIESLANKIAHLKNPENLDSEIRKRMSRELSDGFKASRDILTAMGLVHPSNSENDIESVKSTIKLLEGNPQFFQHSETGDSLISALRSLIQYLLEPFINITRKEG